MLVPLRVLILEDEPADARLMVEELRRGGFDPTSTRVETEEEFVLSIEEEPSVILADYSLPHFNALRALNLLQRSGRDIPFIVVSGAIGEEVAISIMREGASDYLLKDRLGRLVAAVEGVLDRKRLRQERRQAEEERRKADRKSVV